MDLVQRIRFGGYRGLMQAQVHSFILKLIHGRLQLKFVFVMTFSECFDTW